MKIVLCCAAALLAFAPAGGTGQSPTQTRCQPAGRDQPHPGDRQPLASAGAGRTAGQPDDDFDALPCDPLEPTAARADVPRGQSRLHQGVAGDVRLQVRRRHPGARERAAGREGAGEAARGRQLSQLGARPAWHRERAGEPRRHGARSEAAALPLGAVRRHAAVSAEQLVAGGAIAGSQDLLSAGRS